MLIKLAFPRRAQNATDQTALQLRDGLTRPSSYLLPCSLIDHGERDILLRLVQ